MALVCLTALPALALVLYIGLLEREAAERDAEHRCADLVDAFAMQQEEITRATRQMLVTLSHMPEVRRKDANACSALLARLIKEMPEYANILFTDIDGAVLSSGLPMPQPINVADRKFFREAVRTGGFAAGEYVISRTAQRPTFHFALAVVDDAGAAQSVLQAAFDPGHFEKILRVSDLPQQSAVVVSDHAGIVLYSSAPQRVQVGQPEAPELLPRISSAARGSFVATGTGGETIVIHRALSVAPAGRPYMYIRVSVPRATVLANARGILVRNLCLLAAAIVLALAASWWIGEVLIARRVGAVAAAANRMAAGDLAARATAPADGSEVGSLARSFNEMAEAVSRQTAALAASEEQFRTLFEEARDGLLVADSATRQFVMANLQMRRMLGYSADELTRLEVADIHPRASLPEVEAAFGAQIRGEIQIAQNIPVQRKDGSVFQADISSSKLLTVGGRRCVLGIFRDITERLRLEKCIAGLNDLKHRLLGTQPLHEKLKQITDGVVGIFGADFARIWITSDADLCANGCLHAAVTEGPNVCRDRSKCLHLVASSGRYTSLEGSHRRVPLGCYKIGRVASGEDAGFVTNDVANDPRVHDRAWAKSLGLVAFAGYRLVSAAGQPIGVLALFRKEAIAPAEEKLLESVAHTTSQVILTEAALEERKRLFALSLDLLCVATVQGDLRQINPAWTKTLGWPEAELLRRPFADLVHPDDQEATRQATRELAQGKPVFGYENRYRCQDGTYRTLSWNSFPLPQEGLIFAVARDVTDLRRMEERLRQAEKLSAIGQLAGGVAHDFNNQLATIMGCAELVRMTSTDAAVANEAANIINAARRSSQLTGQLLAFARKGQFRAVPLDVNQLVREVAIIVQRSFDRKITIRLQLAPEPQVVLGDPAQLHNALLNLALNARDAMPGGGELIMGTSRKDFGAAHAAQRPQELRPGRHVQISVSDTGTGMTKEVKQHLFEPFFTTKPLGKGTGMGLAAVYGTVRNHQGAVSVYSEPGHGSTFHLYLPASEAALQPAVLSPTPSVAQRQKRVLVVDDEPLLCQMAANLLRALGYDAVCCGGGGEAVAYYREHWQTIDLVILDMIMPGLSGRETYRELRRINAGVNVLLSSGFSINGEAQAILDEGVQGFLQKPYTVQDLSVTVSKALHQGT